jgi:hypothetical protein
MASSSGTLSAGINGSQPISETLFLAPSSPITEKTGLGDTENTISSASNPGECPKSPNSAVHCSAVYLSKTEAELRRREVGDGAPKGAAGDDHVDSMSHSSAWTESTLVPRRSLGFLQCSSLMINQMIGSGIFTTPGYVLLLTKSKPIALALWAVGGIYSILRSVSILLVKSSF